MLLVFFCKVINHKKIVFSFASFTLCSKSFFYFIYGHFYELQKKIQIPILLKRLHIFFLIMTEKIGYATQQRI